MKKNSNNFPDVNIPCVAVNDNEPPLSDDEM